MTLKELEMRSNSKPKRVLKMKYFRVVDKDDIVRVVAAPTISKSWRLLRDAGINASSTVEVEAYSVAALGLPLGKEGILK